MGVARGDAGAAKVVAIADVPERREALEALGAEVVGRSGTGPADRRARW